MSPPTSPLDRLRAWSLTAGETCAGGVRFRQEGEFRLAPGKPWLPFRATQTMSAVTVGFSWRARVRLGPALKIHVCDAFERGRGSLTVRLWGILPLARATDDATSLAQAQRYLAELPWCPCALLTSRALDVMAIDANRLRVATPSPGGQAVVDLVVEDDGRVREVHAAARPRAVGGKTELTPWGGRFGGETRGGGLRVPATAEVWWDLEEGRFSYFRARVFDVARLPD